MECLEVICISDDDTPPEIPQNPVQKSLPVQNYKKVTLTTIKPVPNQFIKVEKDFCDDEKSKIIIPTTKIVKREYDEEEMPIDIKPLKKKDIITKILNLCYANVESTADVLILNKMSKKLADCDASSPEFVHFARKIRFKIQKEPSAMHVHLKELYVEVKAMKKVRMRKETAQVKVKREYATEEEALATNCLPDLVTSHSRNLLLASNRHNGRHETEGDDNEQQPSTSQQQQNETKTEKRIRKLTNLLKACNKKILEYEERELSLEDLDDDDSYYLRLDKYKKKSIQIYKAICRLTGRSTKTGRVTETKFKFDGSVTGTRYEEINRRIANLVNDKKSFPDFCDILEVVNSCNESEGLHLRPSMVEELAREVFRDVGKVLKKRRIDDYREDFGCHLTDNYDDSHDPAEGNEEMETKLKDSIETARIKREQIFDEYTKKQLEWENAIKILKGTPEIEDDDDDDEDEEDEEEDDEGNSVIELTDDEMETEETEHGTNEIVERTEPIPLPRDERFDDISSSLIVTVETPIISTVNTITTSVFTEQSDLSQEIVTLD